MEIKRLFRLKYTFENKWEVKLHILSRNPHITEKEKNARGVFMNLKLEMPSVKNSECNLHFVEEILSLEVGGLNSSKNELNVTTQHN